MIADQFDAFFFDLDGVVYVGREPLPNAVESLSRLRERGAEIRFLTNDPTRTRAQRRDQLNDMGVAATEAEIVTSSWATAVDLADLGVETVYAVGSPGLVTELESQGLRIDADDPDAVVVASDDAISYEDIKRASLLVQDGAAFVATNDDATYPRPEGRVPGTGAIVSAVARTVEARPRVVGKPEPGMFDAAAKSLEGDGDVLMVGDTPSADILGAHRAGHSAALIADEPPIYPSPNDFRRPDATISSLADLFDPDLRVDRWERPSFQWPSAVRASAAAVVTDGDGVLLERESTDDPWRLPVARVEPGETVAETATRAAAAHGVAVEVDGPTGVYSDPRDGVVVGETGEPTQLITTCIRCTPESAPDTDGRTSAMLDADADRILGPHGRWVRDALAGGDPVLD